MKKIIFNKNIQCSYSDDIVYDFHISKKSRDKYQLEEKLFALNGDLIIANFYQARLLSQKINDTRVKEKIFDKYVTPGLINAAGLLHEIFHFIIRYYETNENPGVFNKAINYLYSNINKDDLDNLLLKFVTDFPPLNVYKNQQSAYDYLNGFTNNKSNKEIVIEELILLHLENINQACKLIKELYDDADLINATIYPKFLEEIDKFFDKEKPFSLENLSLFKTLKKPILTFPDDILSQLEYIKLKWGIILNDDLLKKLLSGEDLIREDIKLFIQHGTFGTPPVPFYPSLEELRKKREYEEILEEKYSQDIDWMPKVVMIAKNTLVWLDQLSKKYQRDIKRLDQIPDEELEQLQRWGINSLWLIGVWERSSASKKIKQFCGNPEATSSAYSLFDYEIAFNIGGEEAFQNLKHRCKIRGIRLASDMVPNHTGIYSRWILEHPDYFIQTTFPPFPGYSFSGPDLSDDPKIQIRIEDKYYSKQDAAVVFQYINNSNGYIRYIYHGNDGTNMPWNDTAQLNLLNPKVREDLIQKIMDVARKTPIIRFDAAMTLTKKHYQRLWFPEPGTGGAIPSRADYALTKENFDRLMPIEFWREVVDRINTEMPDTLLLAEAFWLMEGYFVRTLGMHRVYNSAFMHMFLKEENSKYKQLIKNTLEFDPEILKRYVNFMSNPDEETAVNQFGKGDKYFGVAVMMATMPGLPMIAHGQIEGFTEKYGMEYTRAYYNEMPDEYLIRRHEIEIFPLLKKRYLFSQVENFELYDFVDNYGNINENVFAYTNKIGDEKVIVIYNNSYEQTSGRIKNSFGKIYKLQNGNKEFRRKTISEALDLWHSHPYGKTNDDYFYIFKDSKTNLEYIRSAKELANEGLYAHLFGYNYHVFWNFREVKDSNGEYRNICSHLNGKAVYSIELAMKELKLEKLHNNIIDFFNKNNLNELKTICGFDGEDNLKLSNYLKTKINLILSELKSYFNIHLDDEKITNKIEEDLIVIKEINQFIKKLNKRTDKQIIEGLQRYFIFFDDDKEKYIDLIIIYTVIHRILVSLILNSNYSSQRQLFDELMLDKPFWQALLHLNNNYDTLKKEYDLLKILSDVNSIFSNVYSLNFDKENQNNEMKNTEIKKSEHTENIFYSDWFNNNDIKNFISYNVYNNIEYYSKENFEALINWNFSIELIRKARNQIQHLKYARENSNIADKIKISINTKEFKLFLKELIKYADEIKKISEESDFKYSILLQKIKEIK